MLAPLEEANESCYNSPMGSYNEVSADAAVLSNNITNSNSNSSYTSGWKNFSLENIDKINCVKELERIDSEKSQSSYSSGSSDNLNSP